MKVLSLFDGISCGRVALERAGISVSRYVAFEIDQDAINCSSWNYPDIEHRGTVEGADFTEFKGFDLVIGGFPCTDLSIGKNNREGLKGKHSRLFWEQVRAIKEVDPLYFLVENNYRMPKKDEDIITETLGVKPFYINSALVSAQNRERLYWTNLDLTTPDDRGIRLCDILEDRVPKKYYHTEGAINYLSRTKMNTRFMQSSEADKAGCVVANYHKGVPYNVLCTPVKVADLYDNGAQAGRVYDVNAKSVCINANGGGGGAKTGLYAIPANPVRVGTIGKDSPGNRVYSSEGKAITISATSGGLGRNTGLYAIPATGAALRSWPRNTKEGRFKRPEVRYDEKANALTSVQTDSMAIILGGCYLVENGILYFKDKEVPIKLPNGYYAIRKLTPVECERLQTLPDGYTEMLSDTQRYKALGNGWTVEVIAHIFNHIDPLL